MNTKFFKTIGIITMFLMLSYSCNKPFNPDTSTAQDNARAQGSVIDVFGIVTSNADEGGGGKAYVADSTACYDINFAIDTVTNVRSLIITFDSLGCDLGDGVIRKGQIIASISGPWFTVGSVMTITFNNFSRDGNILSGTITSTHESPVLTNGSLTPTYSLTSTNMGLTYSDGKTVSWNDNVDIVWLEGYLTILNRSDDKLQMNSVGNGINRNGEAFVTTGTDLIKIGTCEGIVSGTLQITKGVDNLTIDFGNGECDGSVTVTQNGTSVTVNP
jgi:hypothetical protein